MDEQLMQSLCSAISITTDHIVDGASEYLGFSFNFTFTRRRQEEAIGNFILHDSFSNENY